jgi:hypothetical protein
MTFDAAPTGRDQTSLDLDATESLTVCDLSGAERFLVWAIRWAGSRQEDAGFADLCLQDSFDRAGLAGALPAFRRYVAAMHRDPLPCPALARLGCWRMNAVETHTLHALACLQARRFGDAWRTLARVCPPLNAARAMLSLGELAEALDAQAVSVRAWRRSSDRDGG